MGFELEQSEFDEINRLIQDSQLRQTNYELENYVVMSNELLENIQQMDIVSAKILRLIIAQVKPTDDSLYRYQLSSKTFSEITKTNLQHTYSAIKKLSNTLIQQAVTLKRGRDFIKIPLFEYISYHNGTLTIQLNRALKPCIVQLQRCYTQYRIDAIMRLKSPYSIRIYELIQEALKNAPTYGTHTQTVFIELSAIRKATGTEELYQHDITNYRRRIIDKVIKDLNAYSINHFEYRAEKEHNKVIGFYFDICSRFNTEAFTQEIDEFPNQIKLNI